MAPRAWCSASLAALPFLAACAAPPLPRALAVTAGQRMRLSLTDLATNRTFVLQNASSGARATVYSDSAGDAAVKVVADAQLQELLDVLAAQGMFGFAQAAPQANARELLVAEQGAQRFVWSRPPVNPTNLDMVQRFDESRGYVLAVYNAAIAYHSRELDAPEMSGVRAAIDKARADAEARRQQPIDQGRRE